MKSFFKIVVFLLVSISLLGFIKKVQRKTIRTKEYDEHFYVLVKDIDKDKDKTYYWYKSGKIHHSFGANAGNLLHLDYVKYYRGNELAEKGAFDHGLKNGWWKEWYPEGTLKNEVKWRQGEKNGDCFFYDKDGELIKKGNYKKNTKAGTWVNYTNNDTTWYRKGKSFKEHPKIVKRRLDSVQKVNDSIQGKKSFLQKVSDPFKKMFRKKDSLKN